MRLEWSSFAIADRNAIFDYIETDSPQAAVTVDERIEEQVEELLQFPNIGRAGTHRRHAGVGASAHAVHCGLPG